MTVSNEKCTIYKVQLIYNGKLISIICIIYIIHPYYIILLYCYFSEISDLKKSDVHPQFLCFVYLLYTHNKYTIFFKNLWYILQLLWQFDYRRCCGLKFLMFFARILFFRKHLGTAKVPKVLCSDSMNQKSNTCWAKMTLKRTIFFFVKGIGF